MKEAEVMEGKRILIVDDNEVNIFALECALEEEIDIEVFKVESAKEALKQLETGSIDVVLMDMMMPDMSGYEAIEHIRQSEKGSEKKLPIIAVTAQAMTGDREKCLEAGASDYMSKPVDVAELIRIMASYF